MNTSTPDSGELPPDAQTVLTFWFGELDDEGLADAETGKRWFTKDPGFDQQVRERFGLIHATVLAGQPPEWPRTPRGRLAAVIVLDQFSRNMFRDTAGMFAADPWALDLTLRGMDAGDDRALRGEERMFLYMPLMHSEELANQDRCVAAWRAFIDESRGRLRERLEQSLPFAERHREIIARFGRFPHRNAILGRESTPEEIAFLQEPNSSF